MSDDAVHFIFVVRDDRVEDANAELLLNSNRRRAIVRQFSAVAAGGQEDACVSPYFFRFDLILQVEVLRMRRSNSIRHVRMQNSHTHECLPAALPLLQRAS